MQQIYSWAILLVFVLLVLGSFFFLARSLWQDKEMFFGSWKEMTSFEKISLKVGLILYVAIPFLKEHPSKDWYVTQISIDILTALAGALFVLGALAFLKYAHERNKSKK
ncbi:hypothetical protein LRB11_15735 [Ectothiorhodospira haloalkaliphila]|uniref:hypothetical protein n=1 Tax=Ectothiorhodospira haloalkaliphila TaxID=421628 RepID=UPI001EE7ECEA|nr:hypothetical protein [Ectothiorhodospira haloalkaliphila]MCG5526362.1 hypothetical protein [Ectothiorhodospira haloalkaliphila]